MICDALAEPRSVDTTKSSIRNQIGRRNPFGLEVSDCTLLGVPCYICRFLAMKVTTQMLERLHIAPNVNTSCRNFRCHNLLMQHGTSTNLDDSVIISAHHPPTNLNP